MLRAGTGIPPGWRPGGDRALLLGVSTAGLPSQRRVAQLIDAEDRESTPWWGRCDLDDAHIFKAANGRPVLIDVFCMAGTELYRAILEDVTKVHRRIPRVRMRYALDIPYIARENTAAGILALKKAWALAAE
jgi:hypothetical protein